MAEPLKNIYNRQFFDFLTAVITSIKTDFDASGFLSDILNDEWDNMELKQRMRHISTTLHAYAFESFEQNVDLLLSIMSRVQTMNRKEDSLKFMFLPDFIEVYGLNHVDTSIQAFEKITIFTSCEFAVRPFIVQDQQKMMRQMLEWSRHANYHVRRFASEGCRPRLPWAMALPVLKDNPTDILPILENLKMDESEYVRRSVANNLNDISKDNPELVIQIAQQWKGISKDTDWVVKHACRTLLKAGNTEVLQLFGFGATDQLSVHSLSIYTPTVQIGESLEFSFTLENHSDEDMKVRLEYGLYFMKANGTHARKVFKISERIYAAHSSATITRKQSFKIITIRKLYSGEHQVSIIVNGKEFEQQSFELAE
jgi:3-methyladenine DNA glycosylase AlkC